MLVLRFAFAGSSNSTLTMRIGPILKYLVWRGASDRTWTPSEDDLFDFMTEECPGTKALSRANTIVKAFRFLFFVCRGSNTLQTTIQSPLLAGMAFEHSSLMGVRKQAPELSVDSLIVIETLIFEEAYDEIKWTVMGAGVISTYARSRYPDGNSILGYELEKSVIKYTVDQTKTSRLDTSRLELILLSPRHTVSGLDVQAFYLRRRKELGIPVGPYPLFPARTSEGWVKEPAELTDVNSIIKAGMLEASLVEAPRAASHMLMRDNRHNKHNIS